MASVNFFLISRTQQQSEICKSCVANSHLECGNEGQIAVVMLTKGNSGAVNGLVTCICRSLAGNMEQHGAEVEILQKKLPQIL